MLIQFTDFQMDDVTKLWLHGANQDGWPDELDALEAFEDYISSGSAANTWRYGEIKGIFANGSIIGFANLHLAEPGCFPADTLVMEGGTYLLPEERGKGFNRHIKNYLVKTAFEGFACSWCVFCIPEINKRAISAMEKLPIPFERIKLRNTTHPLSKYLKWKSWKQSEAFVLYGIQRTEYKHWPTMRSDIY